MTTYARIVGGHAVDVTTTDPTKLFHPDVAATFVTVPDGTLTGATFANGVWTPPAPPPPAAPVHLPMLAPIKFYDALTPVEETAILGSTDPLVQTFARRLARALQTDTLIDPNLITVQEGLTYLSVTMQQPATTPPAPYILPARIPHILAGTPQ